MSGFMETGIKITQAEAKEQLINKGEIVLIDVRSKVEFAGGHIKNAINIPMDIIEEEIEKQVPNKDQKIFVNCLSGGRSKMSSAMIVKKGYTNVYDIGGVETGVFELVK